MSAIGFFPGMAVTIVDQRFDLYATGLLGCGAATRVTVAARASADGWQVLRGHADQLEEMSSYLPFVEAFRRWVRDQKEDETLRSLLGDAAPQIAKLAPEIETRLGPFPERPHLPPHPLPGRRPPRAQASPPPSGIRRSTKTLSRKI